MKVCGACVCDPCPCQCGCGWGQSSAVPQAAVLSLRSPRPILCAELLLLLAPNLSFWGRGREFSRIPTVQPSVGHVSFKTRPSPGRLRRGGVILRARPWLVIGQWAGGGGSGGRGPPLPLGTLRPPPQSGAPGKVSASARDSPWPLPSPRAPEPRPPRRLLSRDPAPLTLSSPEAQGQGRRRARGRPGRTASSRCECPRTWPPQLPSQGPSRRGIDFGVLKASSGPSQKSASLTELLDQRTSSWDIPPYPAPS